ncbi:CBS domain-containing protein [Mesobacterium pallidum]|uniref:CBS domain-containing protein n=1 Tax=Mesobacterium pallidum TaxID=2872037 RepID=UPI001EE31A5E|nr:CBS domain-containing protein [Mesobacterium pallidum]
MIVEQILKSKGDSGVITVSTATKISEIADILAEKRIGGVVVSDDGVTPTGILSERDVVRALSHRGAAILEDTAEALMTRNPVCASPRDETDEILHQMTVGRFRHMPVVEGGKLVGIVTIGDVVKARLSELAMEKDALEGMIMGH